MYMHPQVSSSTSTPRARRDRKVMHAPPLLSWLELVYLEKVNLAKFYTQYNIPAFGEKYQLYGTVFREILVIVLIWRFGNSEVNHQIRICLY